MVLATEIQYQSNNSYGNFRGQSKTPEKSQMLEFMNLLSQCFSSVLQLPA